MMTTLLSIVKRPILGNIFCPHETVPTKRIQFTTTIQSLNSSKKSVQQNFSICIRFKPQNWIICELTQNSKYCSQIKEETWLVEFSFVRFELRSGGSFVLHQLMVITLHGIYKRFVTSQWKR